MELHKLIDSIKDKTSSGHLRLPNYDRLLSKLEEMESMIEMEEVKRAFASQLKLIILMKQSGYKHPFNKMHAVLSGPPGVGKTSISSIMAEIWDALGIIRPEGPLGSDETDPNGPKRKRNTASASLTDISDRISDIMLMLDHEYSDTPPGDIPEYIKAVYTKIESSAQILSDLSDSLEEGSLDKSMLTFLEDHDCRDREVSAPYLVVGRGDLIGQHVGATTIKIEELLEKNKGKVIIIEEAYSLYTDERDTFGAEALTRINRFMDEQPDDYIFIFNGYSDLLERSIFRAQPGLKRRIQWTFKIDGYSHKGLFKIFQHQLSRYKNPRWGLKESDLPKIERFFEKNKKYFPYYGGNTENLILFCQLAYGERYFGRPDRAGEMDPSGLPAPARSSAFTLDYNDIISAFESYKIANKAMIDKLDESNPIQMYYS